MPLLLLDEPIAHLDLKHQIVVLDICASLRQGAHAAVLALHDLNLAARFATHALVLDPMTACVLGAVDDAMTTRRWRRPSITRCAASASRREGSTWPG